MEDWAQTHSYSQAVSEILDPALELVGEKWANTDDLSLAQAYIAGKVAEDILEKAAAEATTSSVPESKGPVVIGNIEDDCHALGRKLVSIFLRSAGWKVYDLGNDVLPAEFVDKALEVGAPIVAASAMMYTTAMNIKKLREEIDTRKLGGRIQLAVGGAVFVLRPELVAEVGGDGTARNAVGAPKLMEQLEAKTTSEGDAR
jgi:methanogenic corrinoid protein MtbC1